MVSSTASAGPMLSFRNFSLRCDKSDPQVSFQVPWNWDIDDARRIAVITNSSFLRYQLSASIAGLVPPFSGEILSDGVIGWPVGGEGGLDSKLRVSHAVNFLSTIYRDCLEQSRVSMDQFWGLLSGMEIHPSLVIKDLSKEQKSYFFLALSVVFSFDLYLVPRTKYLMSKPAKPLRELLLRQVEGKALISTSTNGRFQSEFCTDGLVLGAMGQILFYGELADAVRWADQNIQIHSTSDSEDDQFEIGLNLRNVDASGDHDDFV